MFVIAIYFATPNTYKWPKSQRTNKSGRNIAKRKKAKMTKTAETSLEAMNKKQLRTRANKIQHLRSGWLEICLHFYLFHMANLSSMWLLMGFKIFLVVFPCTFLHATTCGIKITLNPKTSQNLNTNIQCLKRSSAIQTSKI